jgi:hypothetical protein
MELLKTKQNVLPCCVCHSKPSEFRLEQTGVCSSCIDAIPTKGKYESLTDREDIATILILEDWSANDCADDFMYQDGNGYCGRFGQFLLFEDDQGFVTFDDELTKEKAEARYNQLFEDGWGAQEDDIYVDGNEVWQGGKQIHIHPRRDGTMTTNRINAGIYLHMLEGGWYPNVWDVNRYGQTLRKGIR